MDTNNFCIRLDDDEVVNTKLCLNLKKLEKFYEIKEFNYSKKFLNKIADILKKLSFQPELFPTMSGNIQLEYENNGKYLEIEITPQKCMNIYEKLQKEESETDFVELNIDTIIKKAEEFYG